MAESPAVTAGGTQRPTSTSMPVSGAASRAASARLTDAGDFGPYSGAASVRDYSRCSGQLTAGGLACQACFAPPLSSTFPHCLQPNIDQYRAYSMCACLYPPLRSNTQGSGLGGTLNRSASIGSGMTGVSGGSGATSKYSKVLLVTAEEFDLSLESAGVKGGPPHPCAGQRPRLPTACGAGKWKN
jgi:hypothetical protein